MSEKATTARVGTILLTALLVPLLVQPGEAAAAERGTSAEANNDKLTTMANFDIPAQSLSNALKTLAEQAIIRWGLG